MSGGLVAESAVQRLLDEISNMLAAPATLESPDFELIAFGAHDPAHGASGALDPVRMRSILGRSSTPETRTWFESFGIASATRPVRTPADAERGIAARLCLPVRHASALLGYVWLLDDGHLDPAGSSVRAALALVRDLAAVLAGDGDLPAALAMSVRGQPSSALAALLPARVVVGSLRAGLAAVSGEVDGQAVHLVSAGTALRGGPAGAGSVVAETGELARSYAEARYAARVGRAVAELGGIARWEDLGAFRLLRDVPGPDPVIESLAEAPELLHTLEVYLDHAGTVARAAEALHIHRQTLYYRLSRIEALTGCDLTDGRSRLLLHMSVKLARLER